MTHPQDVAVPSLPERPIVLPELPSPDIAMIAIPYEGWNDWDPDDIKAQEEEGVSTRICWSAGRLKGFARAAVIADRAAGRASAEPEGFVLVPREPTEAMAYEAMDVHIDSGEGVIGLDHAEVLEVWSAMLAAAPTPTASIAPKGEAQRCTDCGDVVPKGACYCREGCVHAVGYDLAAPKAEGEAVVMGSTLQRVMARLANMLEENQFNEIESIVEDDGFAAPVAQAAAGASEPLYLVMAGGDGFSSTIVPESKLDDAYLLTQWSDLECVEPDDRAEALEHFHEDDNWTHTDVTGNGDRLRFSLNLENGWIEVTRLFNAPVDEYARIGLLEWAVMRWREDVKFRPLVNIYRAGMDKAYRCVIRYAGGDPEVIIGPAHSELVARDIEASKAAYAPGSQPLSAVARPEADADRASGGGV